MIYAEKQQEESGFVSVNTLIQPKKKPKVISASPPYQAKKQEEKSRAQSAEIQDETLDTKKELNPDQDLFCYNRKCRLLSSKNAGFFKGYDGHTVKKTPCVVNIYKERERMTMSMNQVHRIKELQLKQLGPYQIAKELKMDPRTVKKYMALENFSPQPPTQQERSLKLDPFEPLINQWLIEDEQNRRKQRHTGRRVYNRLKEMYPDETEFNCVMTSMVSVKFDK